MPPEEVEYSDEFAAEATAALNPELPEEERVAALKSAIYACLEDHGLLGSTGSGEKRKSKGDKAPGLALVFGEE
ncbi:MAG TPA: hypothetical protein VKY73_07135 [Polyangiaceae bacterium]|nr:hypothetical protein [Polyangiaceae bacterium]